MWRVYFACFQIGQIDLRDPQTHAAVVCKFGPDRTQDRLAGAMTRSPQEVAGKQPPVRCEPGAVLAAVKAAARRRWRWPAASLDRGSARRQRESWPGRRNGAFSRTKKPDDCGGILRSQRSQPPGAGQGVTATISSTLAVA
jgi:hypothetical protein